MTSIKISDLFQFCVKQNKNLQIKEKKKRNYFFLLFAFFFHLSIFNQLRKSRPTINFFYFFVFLFNR
jgi:hypothetical protein